MRKRRTRAHQARRAVTIELSRALAPLRDNRARCARTTSARADRRAQADHRPRRLISPPCFDPRCRHIFCGFARIAARRRRQRALAEPCACGVIRPLVAPHATIVRAPDRMEARLCRNRIFLGTRCPNFVAMTRGMRAFARASHCEINESQPLIRQRTRCRAAASTRR